MSKIKIEDLSTLSTCSESETKSIQGGLFGWLFGGRRVVNNYYGGGYDGGGYGRGGYGRGGYGYWC
jgi:uncharacterized membrane protein